MEEFLKQREDDFVLMLKKYEEQTMEMGNMKRLYEQRLLELTNERNDYGKLLENKDYEIELLNRTKEEELKNL